VLRSVKGGGEADLDPRAITDEQDIVDLDQLRASADEQQASAVSPQPGRKSDEPQQPQPPAPRSPEEPTVAPGQATAGRTTLAGDTDAEFERWAAHNARRFDIVGSPHASPPGTAQLPTETRARSDSPTTTPPAPGDASEPISITASRPSAAR